MKLKGGKIRLRYNKYLHDKLILTKLTWPKNTWCFDITTVKCDRQTDYITELWPKTENIHNKQRSFGLCERDHILKYTRRWKTDQNILNKN